MSDPGPATKCGRFKRSRGTALPDLQILLDGLRAVGARSTFTTLVWCYAPVHCLRGHRLGAFGLSFLSGARCHGDSGSWGRFLLEHGSMMPPRSGRVACGNLLILIKIKGFTKPRRKLIKGFTKPRRKLPMCKNIISFCVRKNCFCEKSTPCPRYKFLALY